MAPNNSESAEDVFDRVKLDSLPKFTDLKNEVDLIIGRSTWWDMYGVDWFITLCFVAMYPIALYIFTLDSWLAFCAGVLLLGYIHAGLATKISHSAAHGGLCENKIWHRPLSTLFIEFLGSFSEELAYDIHIRVHHPYTNIIGLGDSSTWKAPFLPRYFYMFVMPLLIPPLSFLLSISGLIEKRSFFGLIKYMICAGVGISVQVGLLMKVAGFSLPMTIFVIWLARGIVSIPYIHVNIFQHIGLPMYSREDKPPRLYQMASGVLNLPRNILLDYAFGHSIISCHVEHHLFPKLSDNMCLKIKPVVSKFLKKNGLPYNEKPYLERVKFFLDNYETLMVNAPPITHFVGIQ